MYIYHVHIMVYIGFLVLTYSVFHKPTILETLFYNKLRGSNSILKTVFVGLFDFMLLNTLGWSLIVSFGNLKMRLTENDDFIYNTLEVIGAQSALIVASFQFVVAYAEGEYRSGGALKLEKNSVFFSYLRFILISVFGMMLFPDYEISEWLALHVCYLSFLFLIPLVSSLFKTIRFDFLLQKEILNFKRDIYRIEKRLLDPSPFPIVPFNKIIDRFNETLTRIDSLVEWKISKSSNMSVDLIFKFIEFGEKEIVRLDKKLTTSRIHATYPVLFDLSFRYTVENVNLSKLGVKDYSVPRSNVESYAKCTLDVPQSYFLVTYVEVLANCVGYSLANGARMFPLFYNSYRNIIYIYNSAEFINKRKLIYMNFSSSLVKYLLEVGQHKNCSGEMSLVYDHMVQMRQEVDTIMTDDEKGSFDFYISQVLHLMNDMLQIK